MDMDQDLESESDIIFLSDSDISSDRYTEDSDISDTMNMSFSSDYDFQHLDQSPGFRAITSSDREKAYIQSDIFHPSLDLRITLRCGA